MYQVLTLRLPTRFDIHLRENVLTDSPVSNEKILVYKIHRTSETLEVATVYGHTLIFIKVFHLFERFPERFPTIPTNYLVPR